MRLARRTRRSPLRGLARAGFVVAISNDERQLAAAGVPPFGA